MIPLFLLSVSYLCESHLANVLWVIACTIVKMWFLMYNVTLVASATSRLAGRDDHALYNGCLHSQLAKNAVMKMKTLRGAGRLRLAAWAPYQAIQFRHCISKECRVLGLSLDYAGAVTRVWCVLGTDSVGANMSLCPHCQLHRAAEEVFLKFLFLR